MKIFWTCATKCMKEFFHDDTNSLRDVVLEISLPLPRLYLSICVSIFPFLSPSSHHNFLTIIWIFPRLITFSILVCPLSLRRQFSLCVFHLYRSNCLLFSLFAFFIVAVDSWTLLEVRCFPFLGHTNTVSTAFLRNSFLFYKKFARVR